MKSHFNVGIIYTLLALLLFSCGDENTVPKPSTFLRLDIQNEGYVNYQSNCGYSFDVDKIFRVKDVVDSAGNLTCHKDIDFGKLNGIMNLSYIDMNRPLKEYINYALDKMEAHKVKAIAIDDSTFLYPKKRVFGALFELKGDVASPFQFYLTDSTKHFVSGVVYFNSVPNYDSLRPSLDYLKKDIIRMIETFEWGK